MVFAQLKRRPYHAENLKLSSYEFANQAIEEIGRLIIQHAICTNNPWRVRRAIKPPVLERFEVFT